jgi:DNA gyrase/topoisomerase IV subunit A
MRLQRLTGLERDKIVEEYDALLKDIAWYREVLGSEKLVLGIMKDELTEVQDNSVTSGGPKLSRRHPRADHRGHDR